MKITAIILIIVSINLFASNLILASDTITLPATNTDMKTELASLRVNTKNCQSDFSNWRPFKLFKDADLIKTVEPDDEDGILIKGLRNGFYSIDYVSIFGKTETVDITITDTIRYELTLCIDFLDYDQETYVPIIDQLGHGDQYEIKFTSRGCFHYIDKSIFVERLGNRYFARLQDNGSMEDFVEISKELTEPELNLFRHFEVESSLLHSSGSISTTFNSYSFTYKANTIEIDNPSDSWSGFYYLMAQLGWKI